MGKDGAHVWAVLLRRGDPKNLGIAQKVPAEYEGLKVEVDYTSTRPQAIKANQEVHAALETNSRGRVINSNRGCVGFIAADHSGTAPSHLIDDGFGGISDVFDAGGTLVARTVRTNEPCDTAVLQYVVAAVPTPGGVRTPAVGERVRKSRSQQSNPSIGTVVRLTETAVRIVGVDHAHSGDSGQLWISDVDGAAVAVHLEGHDLSQGSAKGAPITQFTFPGLGSSI